ncbi:hypothetical protein [Haloarchaeobius sp. HRN-SO-5]|uniref:hypothetical protein n=1 Tax=Haloarchaeobius sp. HRN-SO-5 TaxID=3446118 RepID=UPI003EBDCF6C
MSQTESTSDGDDGGFVLRFVVWVLALVLLGRAFKNNSLYDLRQLRAEQVLVRLGTGAVLLAFVVWAVFVARTDVMAIVVIASVGLVAMHALPWLFVTVMTRAASEREYAEAKEWRAITDDRD